MTLRDTNSVAGGEPPKKLLKVIVIGAGIGGTAAAVSLCRRGHEVILLEIAPKLMEIGAGIQVAPNMLLLLDRWGLGDAIRKNGISLQDVRILRWNNGEELGRVPVNQDFGDQVVVHRADLHNALLEKALQMPTFSLRLDSRAVDVDFDSASVTLSTGEKVEGDVVIAADGIKSSVRSKIISDEADVAIPTGDAVFRVMLDREVMMKDPELKPFIEERNAIRWIGPGGHIIAYPLRSHQLYNIVLAHPDRGGVDESWTKVGSKSNLLKEYEGWDPRLVKMLSLVPDKEVLEWKLCSHPPLKTWISGSCALIGDACHPMLPYVAQGAAQAVEDAAAIGIILSQVSSKAEIPAALQVYEAARKARAEKVQGLGGETRNALHLPDGPEQAARDLQFAALSGSGNNPDRWGDINTQRFLWGWDAEAAAATMCSEPWTSAAKL